MPSVVPGHGDRPGPPKATGLGHKAGPGRASGE
jgi:hypothetical protein